ncbi:MAG: efflux RND transporter periplasmic adaptor subunit [Acidobacteriota bacterium]
MSEYEPSLRDSQPEPVVAETPATAAEVEEGNSSSGSRWLKIVAPVLLLALGVLAAGFLVNSKQPVAKTELAPPAPLVRVMEALPRTISLDVSSQGTVSPRTEAALVAEVAGRIVSASPSFAAGAFFQKGQTLVRLDARDYELAVTRSEAEVARAKTLLERERAEADVARREWEELGQQGTPSPLVIRAPQVAEAEANLAAAEANLAAAKLSLERTVVRAPFDGRIRDKRADVGQYVAPGQSLGQVYAVDYAEIELPVPDGELAYLDLPGTELGREPGRGLGDGASVVLESEFAGRTQRWRGRVVRTGGEIDRQSRMVPLIARVEDPFRSRGLDSAEASSPLAVGLFVNAKIDGRDVDGVFVLPRVVLRGENRVMVLDDESRLRFRQVSVLRRIGDVVIVDGGLEAGERVCVSPLETPVDGMEVRAVEEAPLPTEGPQDGPREALASTLSLAEGSASGGAR